MEISKSKKMTEQVYLNINKIVNIIKEEAQLSERIDRKMKFNPEVYSKSVEGKKASYSSYSEYEQK